MDEVHKKLDMRVRHNEVNFDVTYKGHLNCSKTYFIDILRGSIEQLFQFFTFDILGNSHSICVPYLQK